jgi:uncharacterized LabA/DUF88 family protein
MSTLPLQPQQVRVITYIDGFNLYFGLRENDWRKYLWIDLAALSRHLLKPDQKLVAAKYFTSRISGSKSKEERQSAWLDAVSTLPDVTTHFGRFQNDRKACQKCGHAAFLPQEKKTDVNIATHLICDAYSDAFDTALIISGDADLVPPVAAVRQLFPTKKVIIAFPPKRFSAELAMNGSSSFQIYESKFRKSQLPKDVMLPSGTIVSRPAKWS